MTSISFVNGLIAGAGIVLALMSYGFLQYIAPVENQQGISSTEIRVGIMLGGLVAAASIGYEYYIKKAEAKNTDYTKTESVDDVESSTNKLDDTDE